MMREVYKRDADGNIVYENGQPIKYKLVTTYEAFVSDINKSEMYDKYGNKIWLNKPEGGTTDHIPAEDYWKDPTKKPGDQQFELTSKYKRNVTKDPVTGEITGNYSIDISSITDNLTFDMYTVHDVKFYVDLLLRPQTMQKFDMNDNPLEDAVNITNHPEQTIHNVVFDMNYQSVQDAYNRPPRKLPKHHLPCLFRIWLCDSPLKYIKYSCGRATLPYAKYPAESGTSPVSEEV